MTTPPESVVSQSQSSLLRQAGEVVEVSDQFVWVKPLSQSGCSGCQQGSCGNKALAQILQPKQTPLKLNTPDFEVSVGQSVTIVMEESQLVKHSAMAYGLPLLLMFVLALLTQAVASSLGSWSEQQIEGVMIISALFGLGLGMKITRWRYQPALPTLEK